MLKLVRPLSYLLSISLIVFLLPLNTYAATPTYHYEWVSQSGTISSDGLAHEYTNLQAGQIITLYLTLYNRTNNTIKGRHRLGNPDNGRQVQTGAWGIGSQTPYQDGTPYFLDTSSFVLNNNRFTYYDGEDVPDNEAITMSWNIKLKDNLSDGIYNLYVRPVSEYKAWTRQVKNGKLLPSTDSDIFWRLVVGEGVPNFADEGVYFAQGWEGNYTLIDVGSGDNQDFPISDYEVVSQHSYDKFPEYIIVKKDDRLYSYNVKDEELNRVFDSDEFDLDSDEIVSVMPSITEKDKFIITISEIVETDGMYGYEVIDNWSYLFDASSNEVIYDADIMEGNRMQCFKYDSKYSRFFVWSCGEGVGTSTPLYTYSLDGDRQSDIVNFYDFGPYSDSQGPVWYDQGKFLALEDQNNVVGYNHLIVIDPDKRYPSKEVYLLGDAITEYGYSLSLAEDQNTIIVGGADSIILLRYDESTLHIMERKYISQPRLYANFIFTHNGRAYYQYRQTDSINVLNLSTWEIEKNLFSDNQEVFTLFSFE